VPAAVNPGPTRVLRAGSPEQTGRSISSPGKLLKASFQTFSRVLGSTDNEDGVLTAECPENIRKPFCINSLCNRLGPPRDRLQDQQLPDPVDRCKELRENIIQHSSRLLGNDIWGGITDTLRGWKTRESLLAKIPRKRGLSDRQPMLAQQLAKLLLAGHRPGGNDLQYQLLALLLIHAMQPPPSRHDDSTSGSTP